MINIKRIFKEYWIWIVAAAVVFFFLYLGLSKAEAEMQPAFNVHCPTAAGGSCANAGWPSVPTVGIRTIDLSFHPVRWGNLEPSNGVFNWANLDELLTTADSHNADVMFVFGFTPGWISANPGQNCGASPAGSCMPPSDVACNGTGTNAAVKAFANATVAHLKTLAPGPASRFKYWEIWNEPNPAAANCSGAASDFYKGSYAQLARITVDVAAILHASGLGILVVSPAPSAGATVISAFLTGFFSDPRNPYAAVDVISVHTYRYFTGQVPKVSAIPAVMQAVKDVLTQAGKSPTAKPIIASEGGPGRQSDTGFTNEGTLADVTPNLMGFTAQLFLIHASLGFDRFYYYAWDNTGGAGMITLGVLENSSIAWTAAVGWLKGATITVPATMDANGTTTMTITKGTYQAQIVWNELHTQVFVPNSSVYNHYRDMGNNVVSSLSGFQAKYNPVILENSTAPCTCP